MYFLGVLWLSLWLCLSVCAQQYVVSPHIPSTSHHAGPFLHSSAPSVPSTCCVAPGPVLRAQDFPGKGF